MRCGGFVFDEFRLGRDDDSRFRRAAADCIKQKKDDFAAVLSIE